MSPIPQKKNIYLPPLFPNGRIHNALILYEEELPFLGDSCLQFDKFRYFKSFFQGAFIHLNFKKIKNSKYYESLLKHNPYLDKISTLDWNDIDFRQFDVIFCVSRKEVDLFSFLCRNYPDLAATDKLNICIYSITELLLHDANYVFPVSEQLSEYLKTSGPGEIYITEDENAWANRWLEHKGIQPSEQLFIMLDSTKEKLKLLSIGVYFDFLSALLERPKIKVLIFDENTLGKELFYREWLGQDKAAKLIFSKGRTLREDLCLLSSTYTKMIFGPCTGLMHCSSSIYNFFVRKGMSLADVPLMVVYTGDIGIPTYNVNEWWGTSPLINCLILKNTTGNKKIILLNNLNEAEKKSIKLLPCKEYTTPILLDFVTQRLIYYS